MDTILGLIFGALASYGVYFYMEKKEMLKRTNNQSVLLLDKIKSVCKLVTVEGDFSEVYHYENKSEHFLKLISSKKKALVIIKAKASVGYDLKKLHLKADKESKKVVITHFPSPEILTIETDFNYYDKKDGLLNKFGADDLTNLNREAKQHIIHKIPESGILESAKKEALEAILIIEKIVETIGWKLDYSAIELPNGEIRQSLEE